MYWDDWHDYDFRLEPRPPENRRQKQCATSKTSTTFWDDIDFEDFFIIGGVIGYVEERIEEERIQDRVNEGIDPDDDGAP